MMRLRVLAMMAAVFGGSAQAEQFQLTLKQAVERALTQNPDMVIARIEEAKAQEGVQVARDPFSPRIGGGSGLAYNNGFPLSIEGSAPSIFQVRANQYLFNRPQTYAVAQAREAARGAIIATGERRDEVVFRIASMFIDVERASRLAESASKAVANLEKVLPAVEARVSGGRELPVSLKEAQLNVLRAQQRLLALESEKDSVQHNLAVVLGYSAADTIVPAASQTVLPNVPAVEETAVRTALEGSAELRRLESNYRAKSLEIKGSAAQKLPRVDLVAQYNLFSKYSHFDQYFSKFQQNNAQFGASIQIPLFLGPGIKAGQAQAELDQRRLRSEMETARNRQALGVHQGYLDLKRADMAVDVAKAEVGLAHDRLSVLLAQMDEGRAALKQVEEARADEEDKWIAFYDAQFSREKARLNVLRQTGYLVAALR